MVRFLKHNQRATLAKDPAEIAGMFSLLASRYDLVNDIASLGQDRRWRAQLVDAVAPQPGEIILDVAAGTGASTWPIARTGAKVIPTDLTEAMVAVGKQHHPEQPFVVGDALHLPFGDGVFDAAVICFGLRNLKDPAAGLAELFRVVRSGGTLVVSEFSTPTTAVMRLLHAQWLNHALPLVSKVASTNAPAYSYLNDSILAWPDQRGLAAMLEAAGWEEIQWRNLTGGIVALHRATKP